jgi:hypothetical protein
MKDQDLERKTSANDANTAGAPPEELWLVSEGDALRAMHPMVLLRVGGTETLFEVEGAEPPSPVAAVLAAAGFEGTFKSPLQLHTVDPSLGTTYVEIMGFSLAGADGAVVENALQRALLGDTGGFAPVHAALTSFHQTAMVFEHVWAAAGRPRVLLKHRALLGAMGGAAPAAFHTPSVGDVRLAATLVRYDELPELPELPETPIEG